MAPTIEVRGRTIGEGNPTYFIADISANHDGDLERAKALIHLCARAGADAAKFQNFRAPHIVSRQGFEALGTQMGHQSRWKKSVFQVYEEASIPWEWTPVLKAECDAAGIDYFSTPYDFDAVDMLDPYVELYKIGSGDLSWTEMLERIASKQKPVLLATGASTMDEVQHAVQAITRINPQLLLMQCNTNYTGSVDNFSHIHLNVLRTYRAAFPDLVLGLSDHTRGAATTLAAIALGAAAVEKHFTDDTSREGPDHPFSMDPVTWREMVDRAREVELALGFPRKEIAGNEKETAVVQRRCIRAARVLPAGEVLDRGSLEVLRPAPHGSIPPYELERVLGARLRRAVGEGEHLTWAAIEG